MFLWAECNIRIVADFRQNDLFSAGDKTTVSQNDRFDNPECLTSSFIEMKPRRRRFCSPAKIGAFTRHSLQNDFLMETCSISIQQYLSAPICKSNSLIICVMLSQRTFMKIVRLGRSKLWLLSHGQCPTSNQLFCAATVLPGMTNEYVGIFAFHNRKSK